MKMALSSPATLVRDASPTWHEILGQPDPAKRTRAQRARDLARDELYRRYRLAERDNELSRLDPAIRLFCEEMKRLNGGNLPRGKGGRPRDEHYRLLIRIAIEDALAVERCRGRAARPIQKVLEDIGSTASPALGYEAVRAIYYDRDPEWIRTVRAELVMRRADARAPVDNLRRPR